MCALFNGRIYTFFSKYPLYNVGPYQYANFFIVINTYFIIHINIINVYLSLFFSICLLFYNSYKYTICLILQ